MPLYSRKNIADGIGYTTIIDPKFKTNIIQVMFMTELKKETVADNAMAIGIIGSSNSKYKNLSVLTDKLNELYGANINVDISKHGDIQKLSISVNTIHNRYALEGEDISSDILNILTDCIFSPNAVNGKFADEPFNFRKKDLLDTIESEVNNKRGYAILRANKEIFKGESSANTAYGTKASVEKVTAESTYKAYENMLKTSQIEIFFAGPEMNESVEKVLTERFNSIDRTPIKCSFINPSKIKDEVSRIEESLDVNQCKMVIALKTDYENTRVMKFFNVLLGATAVSKLFTHVREEKSLCYYCSSNYDSFKRTLFIDCGIEENDIEETEKEILNQIEEMKKGNITDEEMNHALLSLKNSLKSIDDSLLSYIRWYFDGFIKGNIVDTKEMINVYSNITKQQIIDAANTLRLDTVYVMKGEDFLGN